MNIYDIAKEAQTSISTVSRVLNNKGNVNPETKRRIEEALKKHNYVPSEIARGMVSKSMRTVAIITVDVRVSHYAHTVYIIEKWFSEKAYDVIVCNTGGSMEESAEYINRLLKKKIDGIVFVGSVFNEMIHYPHIIDAIEKIPFVMANGKVNVPNCYSVLVDDLKGGYLGVEHLYHKGHRDIVYVRDMETESAVLKSRGFVEAMNHFGIADAEKRVICCQTGLAGGAAAADQILKKWQQCTGIFCGEDITAIGIMKRLQEKGYKIPEDFSVVGYNNFDYAKMCSPELTVIDNNVNALGENSAKMLEDVLENKTSFSQLIIEPKLVERQSSGGLFG